MTNAELIAKIKAEIERRMDKHWEGLPNADAPEDDWTHNELCELGAYKELEHLETFLDTLESEKPMELEDEINRTYHDGSVADTSDLDHNSYENIARHFAEWGAEHAKKDEIPVPADLEEAAFEYEKTRNDLDARSDNEVVRRAFVAGAKWHADHTPLPEDTVLFNRGVEEGKRLMMKEAVKWLVDDDYDELTDKGGFILGSVGIGYNGYYIPYGDLLKLPKEDEK